MKIPLFIALVSFTPVYAGLPSWWPASKGEVAKAKEELGEVDVKTAEALEKLFQTDAGLIALLELSQELGPHTASLKLLSQMTEQEIKELMEITRQRFNKYSAEKKELSEGFSLGGLDFGTIARGLAGDPTALIGGISTLLLGGATLNQRKKAKNMKKKAIKWAGMDSTDAKKELVADRDIPEIE